jgi:hypothetical protein
MPLPAGHLGYSARSRNTHSQPARQCDRRCSSNSRKNAQRFSGPELHKRQSERFRISVKNGNALGVDSWYDYMDIRLIEPMTDGAS